jgi:hypothetical protein
MPQCRVFVGVRRITPTYGRRSISAMFFYMAGSSGSDLQTFSVNVQNPIRAPVPRRHVDAIPTKQNRRRHVFFSRSAAGRTVTPVLVEHIDALRHVVGTVKRRRPPFRIAAIMVSPDHSHAARCCESSCTSPTAYCNPVNLSIPPFTGVDMDNSIYAC